MMMTTPALPRDLLTGLTAFLLPFSSSMSVKPRFITNRMCPFAQKAWIALEVCQADYDFVEISLYGSGGKPDWFWDLNPRGTVPVLDCGHDGVCADSDDILDHIDWVQGGHALKALDKEMEERVSMWRRKVNEMLPIGKKAVLGGSKAKLMQLLKELDSEVVGPYLCGKQVTVADCATFPFFWRLDNEYDLGDVCPNLLDWLRYCQDENPAFTKTVQTAWWWWW